jgi:hypothetical protein
MLKQTLSTIVCASILTLSASGQSADSRKSIVTKNAPKGTIAFTTQKMSGFGPSGNMSMGIGSYDPYDNEGQYKAYPKIKNKPVGLHGTESYFYILDDFQFFFQNYCQGVLGKNFFMETAASHKWHLQDTVKLSRQPLKVGIAVLAGYTETNELVYVLDANNNGDFGDDVLRPVVLESYRSDPGMAVPVYTEYVAGKQIKNERILVYLHADKHRSDDDKIGLMFSFPELDMPGLITRASLILL